MASISNWPPFTGLPNLLEDLLKETEINNSFTDIDTTAQLHDSMESSYAYLYKLQEDGVKFRQYHYETREFLLNTTYNDIHKGLKFYGDQLMDLLHSDNPDPNEVAKLKRTLAEFGENRFGDLYLDHRRRVSILLPQDMVQLKAREAFRTSSLYGRELTIDECMANAKLFDTIPVILIDDALRTDMRIFPTENGTRITFINMRPTELYNTEESQIFHRVCAFFTPPVVYCTASISYNELVNGELSLWNFPQSVVNSASLQKRGTFFAFIHFNSETSHMVEALIEGRSIFIHLDRKLKYLITKNVDHYNEVSMTLIYFQDMHRFDFRLTDTRTIPVNSTVDSSGDEQVTIFETPFFIPMRNGSPYPMPIPERNMLVMRSVFDDDYEYIPPYIPEDYTVFTHNIEDKNDIFLQDLEKDPEDHFPDVIINYTVNDEPFTHYSPMAECSVNLRYPNFYQVIDKDMNQDCAYRVYYAYHEIEGVRYTPLFDFYWEYMSNFYGRKFTVEEILNVIYFKHRGYDSRNDGTDVSANALLDMLSIFKKMIDYKDYRYLYNTPDFICQYKGDNIPLQYKIARMMEFIRADWTVLPDYVRKERKKETLYHLFTNTINLRGRFRRSTRLESKEAEPVMFASECHLVAADEDGALVVSDSLSYDRNYEVYIDDVRLSLPSVEVGDYVKLEGVSERYVFAFRNEDYTKNLPLKIYVDGLLCMDVIIVHSLGMDYLYIPVSVVNTDSYIMIEREYVMDDPILTNVVFNNSTEWKTVHLVESGHTIYTMNDVIIKQNGITIDKSNYTVNLVKNGVSYSMEDSRHGVINKYGIVTDISIQMTNMTITTPITVTIHVEKSSMMSGGECIRRGYPRFDLRSLNLLPNPEYVKFYVKGRMVPSTLFTMVKTSIEDVNYIQSKIFCEKGDWCMFEYSPYMKELICTVDEFDPDAVFDFSKYIDKPIDPCYYEVYVNGRRLGLPNIFAFGPKKGVFRGLKSNSTLVIYEKERDFEYYGYSKISGTGDPYEFYYLPSDLVNESFVTEEEAKKIIDTYINNVKHPNAVIRPNVIEEDPIVFSVEYGMPEQMKIFYFEELLPTEFVNPSYLQFSNRYLSEVFPDLVKEYVVNPPITGNPKVVFLNPNKTARIINPDTGEYIIIDTHDANPDKQIVMLTGDVYPNK